MKLLVVESPAKCKTIKGYLGAGYEVVASYGHIRDLVPKNGSIDVDHDFSMKYETTGKKQVVDNLVKLAKSCDTLYLATDPDREGEAISWHVLELLKDKKAIKDVKVERITFNQITKTAIQDAIKSPRQVDSSLVDAQEARRGLDYLVGFNLSPILWRKMPGCKSAGRVQSVALRLICQREDEIDAFKKEEYWTLDGVFSKLGITVDEKLLKQYFGESDEEAEETSQKTKKSDLLNKIIKSGAFIASLTEFNNEKIEKSVTNQQRAQEIYDYLSLQNYFISDIEVKDGFRNPYAPFTTSTLQQDASNKLGFTAKRTMSTAQELYESGLITYMRTDSPTISNEGISAIRGFIKKSLGEKYLSKTTRIYTSKAKNSQEAHEAIRPTDPSKTPQSSGLSGEKLKLYDLIWKRAVASQCESAILESTKISIENHKADNYKKVLFRTSGSVMKFDGFLTVYNYSEGNDVLLPELSINEELTKHDITKAQHFTQPPPRYTEAGLVKKLEELGIGRPSTYATIITILQDREYVKMDGKKFVPEQRGRVLIIFLEAFFKKYIEYDFTANLENDLDYISDGKIAKKDFLQNFWGDFHSVVKSTESKQYSDIISLIGERLEHLLLKSNAGATHDCPKCGTKDSLKIKIGKFGPFISCSNYPECKFIMNTQSGLSDEEQNSAIDGIKAQNMSSATEITKHSNGQPIYLKSGPYGPYLEMIQIQDVSEITTPKKSAPKEETKTKGGKKTSKKITTKAKEGIKRVSIPKSIPIDQITPDIATKLIELPLVLGQHPTSGNDITLGIGRFGPFFLHNKKFTSCPDIKRAMEEKLNYALTILKV